jgi:para-nitrobenzyl esterase
MVWIHGGAFVMGAGSLPLYHGSTFVTDDLVGVTINYRLGVLGLCGGNFALLDQIAALGWVQRNIAAFGGDPARVTVMGESAGAIAIAWLLVMPAARGLFQRAILQSGAVGLGPHTTTDAEVLVRDVRAAVGDPQTASIDELLAAQATASAVRGLSAFAPFIDGDAVPRVPLELVRAGETAQVPLLLGSNRDEWALFDTLFGAASTQLLVDRLRARLGPALDPIHQAYAAARGDRAWVDVCSDVAFRIPMIRLAEAHARFAPVHMYRFDWASPAMGGRLGAAHALELPLIWNRFDNPLAALLIGGDVAGARPVATEMHAIWADFIHGREPPWPRYEAARRTTKIFDRTSRVEDDPDGALRAVWPVI